ncbi:Uncharacterised protein [Starkeya nomas]|uniref:Phage tail collar domain-containing protein n=1 Tax=Starkeya nomas TaxID=2666134 RepID=A0A5S9PCF1_9HYPH|nr:hypothetical protein [Starkeya nomas]CAA0101353.1 Uncharacterised protein [Starkeya nomas]
MPVIDDRTAVLDVPKPNAANNLSDDVERLRLMAEKLAVAIHANAQEIALRALLEHAHEIGHITGLLDALNSKSDKTHKHALDDLSDVDAPDPANYHVMVRIGDKWVSAALVLAHITGWEDTVDAKIDGKIAALAGSAPATLDTFAEIAAALGNDPNLATTISTALGHRVRFDEVQSRTAEEKTRAQTNLGGTDVGRAVFEAADKAAARTAIGAVPASHPHPISAITDLQAALDSLVAQVSARALGTDLAWTNGQVASKPNADSISHVGLASGDPNKPYMRQASNSAVLYLQRELGFTAARQGSGNIVTITWDGGRSKVTITIDATYMGDIAFEQWVAANFAWKSEVYIKNPSDFASVLANANEVGAVMFTTTAAGSAAYGTLYAGSSLAAGLGGTWRCMSRSPTSGTVPGLFVRVA